MLPKEHGAYGQVAFPLVTAFVVAGLSSPGVCLAIATVAGFLAHEPAAMVLGLRGLRARCEQGRRAKWWLGGWVAILIATGLAAAALVDAPVRWSFIVPAVPAALLVAAMLTGREKTWFGETAAALAFSGVAVPVAMAAGASIDVAWRVAIPFALLFIATTLSVRVVILRVRGGGNAVATAITRRWALTISIGALMVIGALTGGGWLASSVLMAAAPGLITAAIVAARPPAAARLRTLGWSLVAVSVLTTAIVIATVS